jgi:hypothetical protein
VNSYIREVAAQDFTARDFRYVGRTIEAVSELRAAGPADTETAQKTVVVEAVKQPLALFHCARQPPIGQLHSDRGSRRKKRFRSWANRTRLSGVSRYIFAAAPQKRAKRSTNAGAKISRVR